MKTLEDLFFGRNIPFESPALDPDEYRRLVSELVEFETPLRKSMTAEQEKLLDDYHDCLSSISVNEERDAFIRGFRLGVQVILESLAPEKAPAGK